MTEEQRAALVKKQLTIALGGNGASNREATAAFRALLEADKVNADLEPKPTTTHLHAVVQVPANITAENLDDARAAILQEFDRVCGDG
jgi:hypothetical protein